MVGQIARVVQHIRLDTDADGWWLRAFAFFLLFLGVAGVIAGLETTDDFVVGVCEGVRRHRAEVWRVLSAAIAGFVLNFTHGGWSIDVSTF